MSSNSKGKHPAREAPTEPFKRAVAGCLRAIAKRPELEVGFAAERHGLAAGKARLPEPPRKLSTREAAIVRGHADSIALRLACHNPAVHRRLIPGGQEARAARSTAWAGWSRPSAGSQESCTATWTRSIWARTAATIPRRTTGRRATRMPVPTIRVRTARPGNPTRPRE